MLIPHVGRWERLEVERISYRTYQTESFLDHLPTSMPQLKRLKIMVKLDEHYSDIPYNIVIDNAPLLRWLTLENISIPGELHLPLSTITHLTLSSSRIPPTAVDLHSMFKGTKLLRCLVISGDVVADWDGFGALDVIDFPFLQSLELRLQNFFMEENAAFFLAKISAPLLHSLLFVESPNCTELKGLIEPPSNSSGKFPMLRWLGVDWKSFEPEGARGLSIDSWSRFSKLFPTVTHLEVASDAILGILDFASTPDEFDSKMPWPNLDIASFLYTPYSDNPVASDRHSISMCILAAVSARSDAGHPIKKVELSEGIMPNADDLEVVRMHVELEMMEKSRENKYCSEEEWEKAIGRD